jgi:hypothetical protein
MMAKGDICWICELPLGNPHSHDDLRRSRDHVRPIRHGGRWEIGNIRWAHRWCNSSRGTAIVTEDLRTRFKARMMAVHGRWFVLHDTDTAQGLKQESRLLEEAQAESAEDARRAGSVGEAE